MTTLNSMKHYMPCVPCRHKAEIKTDSKGNMYTEKFSFCDTCEVKMLFNKLKEYEDAEEQGLLLRLPVSEGSTVFTLGYLYECKHDYECVLKYNKNKCEENVPCEHEHKQWMVREAVFNYKMLKAIGTTVFFTKEEAEQALARMEKENG